MGADRYGVNENGACITMRSSPFISQNLASLYSFVDDSALDEICIKKESIIIRYLKFLAERKEADDNE